MRIINEMEMRRIIEQKQKDLKVDSELRPETREIADWGIDQLEQVKFLLTGISFEATLSQYKSNRNGV